MFAAAARDVLGSKSGECWYAGSCSGSARSPLQSGPKASGRWRELIFTVISPRQRNATRKSLFSLLDDPSPIVRKSIAEAFASAVDAPHAIVLALANDQSAISSVVLGRSPLLCDADLIDCAAVGDAFAQAAITLRPLLSMSVSAALAEIGSREALIALAVNPGAEIADFSSRTITSGSASTAKCAKRCSRADNYRRRCEARWSKRQRGRCRRSSPPAPGFRPNAPSASPAMPARAPTS